MKFSNPLVLFCFFIFYENFGKCVSEEDPTEDMSKQKLSEWELAYRKGLELLTEERSGETQPILIGSDLLVVDLDERNSTEYIKYETNRNFTSETYTTKHPYLIAKLKRGEKVIWDYKSKRCPYKVKVIRRNRGTAELTMFYHEDQIKFEVNGEEEVEEQPRNFKKEFVTPEELEKAEVKN